MSEQLQHLLEKIRTEGVTKADAEARSILVTAREETARLERDAVAKAGALVKQAEALAQTHADRGRKALEQASRDMILTVSQSVETLFTRLLQEKVDAAFTPETFQAFLLEVIKTFLAQGHSASALELIVPPDQEKAVRDFILKAFQESLVKGLTIRSSNEVLKGFRVSFTNHHVEHDFSAEAIAEAMARLVRPHLADLLRSAVASAPKPGATTP